jgi:hypothetical protein
MAAFHLSPASKDRRAMVQSTKAQAQQKLQSKQ